MHHSCTGELNQFFFVSMRTEYSCYDNVTQVSFLSASWEPCNAAAGFSIDKGKVRLSR